MWTIYFAFFALLVGGGMTFVSIAPAEFVYAKACFVTAGIMAMVGLFLWLTRPEWEAVNYRSLIAFLAYGLVGVTIVAAWQWVADRENGALAEKQRQINFIVPLKEYLRCGEQHLRDLKGSPAPTFDASREVAMKWQSEIETLKKQVQELKAKIESK